MLDNKHITSNIATDVDLEGKLRTDENRRRKTLRRVEVDLYRLALRLGQTPEQARTKVENLFRTFVSEVFLYMLLGTDDLAVAINADASLTWLNVDASGTSIRQHLVNRLTP